MFDAVVLAGGGKPDLRPCSSVCLPASYLLVLPCPSPWVSFQFLLQSSIPLLPLHSPLTGLSHNHLDLLPML